MSLFGRSEPETPAPGKLAQQRIAAARACRKWQEIDAGRLVRRERGYFVDAESDAAYRRYAGDAFSPSGTIVADQTALAFYVAEGDVCVLERQPRKWSEIVYQRERAGAR
jgi:hypothetical protein